MTNLKELIKQGKARIKTIQSRPYQRGDAEMVSQERMFISIFETGMAKEKELGREMTTEEKHQNLYDHGWTIGGEIEHKA